MPPLATVTFICKDQIVQCHISENQFREVKGVCLPVVLGNESGLGIVPEKVVVGWAFCFVFFVVVSFTLDLQLQPSAAHDSMYTTLLMTLYSTLDQKYKAPT